MRLSLEQRVLATIRTHAMLQPGDCVGVAVSGGADSLSLLLLLADLRGELGIQLAVAHFNHLLRGAESDADEEFVWRMANQLALKFLHSREDVRTAAKSTNSNLEDAARHCRYAFFARLVKGGSISRVAVAHTADDQAETVLGKMIRGAGLTGLGGIHPVVGHVIRPFIELRRIELRDYLRSRAIAWREDPTNRDETRLRSRIRARLLPVLENEFQRTIVSKLSHLAALSREDDEFWTSFIEERFCALVRRQEGSLRLSVVDLRAPLAMATANPAARPPLKAVSSRLVRRILEELKGDLRGFTARHVADVIRLASNSTSGHRIDLPFGIVVERCFDELCFRAGDPLQAVCGPATTEPAREFRRLVAIDGCSEQAIEITEIGTRLRLKVIDWPAGARDTKQEAPIADLGRLVPPLMVRNWLPGDAMKPEGRLRSRKLKELLLERRIALDDRQGWPVLTSGGELVWARGFRVDQRFAPSDTTRKALVISEEPV